MKTQRRHELQTNELADYLGKYLQQIQPYSRHITIGLGLVVVAIIAGVYYSNMRAARQGAGWSDYLAAFGSEDSDALEEVAKLHGGTTAALWSLQSAGDIKLAMGTRQIFTDRDEAEESLKDAEEHFLAVEKDATGHPQLVQRAKYGLAQVNESLCKIDKARTYYDEVAKLAPDSALGKSAKRRHDRLANKSVEGWYAWFERQESSMPPMPPGGPMGGPDVSDDLDMLPARPDISFPGSEISKELQNLDLDAPLGKESIEPMSPDPKETSATDDNKETTEPEPEGDPKPDDSATEPRPADEGAEPEAKADESVEKPASEPAKPAPADTPKPTDKPAAAEKDDTEPAPKDASS
ncbi:MAG: hypothetical protein H8E44_37790 [Planctomycetes bacterium]|nr:hypothetical protein [Planctomycetota bacterium]